MIYINNQDKLARLKLTKNNFYIVSDFDQTITQGNSCGSWDIDKENSQEYIKQNTDLYNKYRPVELDNTLPTDEKFRLMETWYKETLELLIKYNITEKEVEDTAKSGKFKLRDGTKEFFEKMHMVNVPILILSAGIGNIITQVLEYNDIFFDNIHLYSNFLVFKDGKAQGVLNNIIHTMNKNSAGLLKMYGKLVENKENVILFGDVISDINMVSKEKLDKTITVGFLDNKIDENIDIFCKTFDIVCTENTSFIKILDILKIEEDL